ncbi:MAG TPA: hypothetical protein VEK15_24545 [Vicinamibacteria bacterium]|nr:hypothetical protein [Vicinamibacteria bacterium]
MPPFLLAQPAAGSGPYFPLDSVWYQDVTGAPVDTESADVIQWLSDNGGWGTGSMRIDFSIEVLEANATTPFWTHTPKATYYTPDCDLEPVPVPPGGALEGETGYECLGGGDCHLIVVHPPTHRLFELWSTDLDVVNEEVFSSCLAVWNMLLTYPTSGRGEQCTSADAAGFPIAPLLFSADEVAAGSIDHAIRFILPNHRIRAGVYVHPANHAGGPSAPWPAPPYGARLRLRADFPLNALPNEGARVVARAMQKYGILLADGGSIALTAQSDRFTVAKWEGLLGTFDLTAIQVSDFEMIEAGPRIPLTYDCVRIDPIFVDGFELGNTSKWSR